MTAAFHPAARTELAAAARWYELRAAGLGADLNRETQIPVARICESPMVGKALNSVNRAYALNRFPFQIVYRVDGLNLRIIAVAHNRRRPQYWQSRR